MREIEVLRRTHRRMIHREVGRLSGPGAASVSFHAELIDLQADTVVARDPEDVAALTNIQGPGGGFAFIVDFSVVDGPDVIL